MHRENNHFTERQWAIIGSQSHPLLAPLHLATTFTIQACHETILTMRLLANNNVVMQIPPPLGQVQSFAHLLPIIQKNSLTQRNCSDILYMKLTFNAM